MTTLVLFLIWVILPVALLPRMIKSSRTSRAGADLARAGLMELQNQLEPERKVEVVRELEQKKDLLVGVSPIDAPDEADPSRS